MTEVLPHHSFWSHLRFVNETVLGLNRRNSHYIHSLNPIHLLPLVDEKLLTKERLAVQHLPTPATYGVVRYRYELRTIPDIVRDLSEFALKPARGFGGGGIVICKRRDADRFAASGGRDWGPRDFEYHIDAILDGGFSLDQQADAAFFEELIHDDPALHELAVGGIPDVRFLVVQGVPILGMLRLPTARSGGRANLHVGGVGVGIDMISGRTQHGIYQNYLVRKHPDSKRPLAGFALPQWEQLLEIAARCYEAVPLGYLGVDIVFDQRHGPLVLELNARPGLQIQLANRMGLRAILEALSARPQIPRDAAQRVALGRELYTELRRRFTE